MLVDAGFDSSREPTPGPSFQLSLQVGYNGLDGICLLQAAVEDLPKALHWLFCDRPDLVLSQPEAELVTGTDLPPSSEP